MQCIAMQWRMARPKIRKQCSCIFNFHSVYIGVVNCFMEGGVVTIQAHRVRNTVIGS